MRVKSFFLIHIFLLMHFTPVCIIGAGYVLKNWPTEHPTITAIYQTSDVYVWIGSQTGLYRFDGTGFYPVAGSNSAALKNKFISAIYEDQNRNLWVGTRSGGIFRCKNKTWQSIATSDKHIRSITGDWHGNIWIGTDYGLNKYAQDSLIVFTTDHGLHDNIITSLALDFQGNLWIGTFRAGVICYQQGEFIPFNLDDGLLNLTVTTLQIDQAGQLLIGTQEGLFQLDPLNFRITGISGFHTIPVTAICTGEKSELIVGTMTNGLHILKSGKTTQLSPDEGLADDYVRDIYRDSSGLIWIGTDAGGLQQLHQNFLHAPDGLDHLSGDVVTALLADQHGKIWIGTRNRGIYLYDDSRIKAYTYLPRGRTAQRIRTLFQDKKGKIWIGSDNAISTIESARIRNYATPDGISVLTFFQEQSGEILIGTSNGLYQWQSGSMSSSGLRDIRINCITQDKMGILYLGTGQGVFMSTDSGFTRIDLRNDANYIEIYSLLLHDTVLWIGTNGQGLIRWHQSSVARYSTANGLPDDHVCNISVDIYGNIWLGTFKGVCIINQSELAQLLNNEQPFLVPIWYDQANGMPGSQCQPGTVVVDSTFVYMPTKGGLAIFPIARATGNSDKPKAAIKSITTAEKSYVATDSLILFSDPELLDFHLSILNTRHPDKTYIRYRLGNYESDFRYLSPDAPRVISYRNLAYGKYQLFVQALEPGSRIKNAEAVMLVSLSPPFFARPFVLALFALFIIMLSASIIITLGNTRQRKNSIKYRTVNINEQQLSESLKQIQLKMEIDKIYRDPDLTLHKLARQLHLHSTQLSRILNEHFKQGFNDYINRYRIRDARELLSDLNQKNRTISDIMLETGFYSKSVFNTIFKKITGQTPSQYRKNQSYNK